MPLTTYLATAVLAAALTSAPHQPIAWHTCLTTPPDPVGQALNDAGARCADITVPLDYRRPQGDKITVAISRITATDPAHRRGVLLVNPGGPGTSGLDNALLGQYSPELGKAYDLIGFDPRFIGRSTPLECRWNTSTFQRSAGPDLRGFRESVAFEARLAAGCADKDLPYDSTRNAVRDLDLIRQALGEQRISYLGFSYGTYLGAVYLQMFGDHADRVVLDSSVDPGAYGPNLFRNQGPARQAALVHFAQWAAGHEGLGDTAQDVLATVTGLKPTTVGKYTVDEHELPYLIYTGVADDSKYEEFAATVRSLRDGTPPPADLTEELDGLATGSGDPGARFGTPVLCADRAVSHDPLTYYRDIQAHRADEPLFGPLTRNISPCAFWPTVPIEPPTTVHNGVPVLMVGAAGDPVTPNPGQLAMHRDLTASRLVTQLDAYHHGAFLGGSACIDAAVVGYLTGGALPAADSTCT